jgi:hypothetical protein
MSSPDLGDWRAPGNGALLRPECSGDLFVRRDGRWQAVAMPQTVIQ